MPTSLPATFTIGEILNGKYRVVREIGRGAMGVVYEAVHTELGRRVAIKTLAEEANANAQRLARFEREARAASAIPTSSRSSIWAAPALACATW
jgi:serine/threonine protein kinase